MSTASAAARKRRPAAAAPKRPRSAFTPVPSRARQDGWTPGRQVEFIEALAECGCVAEACRRVGMSDTAAYRLRARPTAQSFRQAWDVALETAIRRLSDAAFSRALHGVARPVFYKGEQIGERRYYDERLTQFLLRYRDPVRYGTWNDKMRHEQTHPDAPAIRLAHALNRVTEAAVAEDEGVPPPRERPFHPNTFVSAEQQEADAARREEYAEELHRLRMNDAWERSLDQSVIFGTGPDVPASEGEVSEGDVAPTSQTSDPAWPETSHGSEPDGAGRAFFRQQPEGPAVTDPQPPAATGSPDDVTGDGGAAGESPWAAPSYEPHPLHAAGRTFSVVETNGVAEAEVEGKTGADAPNRLDRPDTG